MMDKHAVARVLAEIATLMELRGENQFRARAFQGAARTLEGLEGEVAELVASGALAKVKGIGPATFEVIRELVETGESSLYQELRSDIPDGLLELLGVPGLGARRIHTLHKELGIASLDDLEAAATEGRVATLPGFGAKTQQKLLEGVAFVRSVAGRRRLPEALAAAESVIDYVAALEAVVTVEAAGELRRSLETVGTVDLVAATTKADAVLGDFMELPGVTHGERVGAGMARVELADGAAVRLRCVGPADYAVALAHATASPEHWQALVARAEGQGYRLDETGLWGGEVRIELANEAELYRALDLDWIAPELREGRGEIEAAAAGELPNLVALEDLRGCFHCHTDASDGRATLREMAEGARARGWRYLGIADHSMAASYAGGLKPDEIARQHEAIDAWNEEHGDELWIFKGIEADILPDGRLDYADEDEDVLARFDYVVGSVHSSFGLSEAEQTARVIRAMENPHLTFLGHPTGRLLLAREAYRIDLDAVIDAAAEHGVGIEINSNPWRLDMDWRLWRKAKAKGVRTAINPDAHSVPGLDDVRWGVAVARKGWLTPSDVVNTYPVDEVRKFFSEGRKR